ncbi:MAG: GDP-mannose 4,6-dehydratase, partial [Verrucomicrobiota bacterium]
TGITGQDGSYLAEQLLDEGYEVHGMVRRVAIENPRGRYGRIEHLLDRLTLKTGSLESYVSIFNILAQEQYDECYHLAAQSFVAESFLDGFSTIRANIEGTYHFLTAIRQLQPDCRFYFAGSSEMFGDAVESPQNEETRFRPRSPYGISKMSGYELVRNFRESEGLFCGVGLLFNHESPRRGRAFVTRKIANGAARIKAGLDKELLLGNLDARRDWGHARDYVRAMRLILSAEQPDDFVIGTGETHSVREFCEKAFGRVGLDYQDYVKVDPRFVRNSETVQLVADPSKAAEKLNWKPAVSFQELVEEMVDAEVAQLNE